MTREEAIALEETRWWEGLSDVEIAHRQLWEPKVIMDWSRYYEVVDSALGRQVGPWEYCHLEKLQREFTRLHGEPEPQVDKPVTDA